MQIFEQQYQWRAFGGGAEVGDHVLQRRFAHLARVAQQRLDVRAVAEVIAQQMADAVGGHLSHVFSQQGAETGHQLVGNGRRRVVVVDAAAEDKHVAQQAERQVLRFQPGATAIELDVDRL